MDIKKLESKTLLICKILSLLSISIISVIFFQIEAQSVIPDSSKFMWPLEIRWSLFIAVPVLFFTWLFLICRLEFSWKTLFIVLFSYSIWFLVSYQLWESLTGLIYGAFYSGFFELLFVLFINLLDNVLHLPLNDLFINILIVFHFIILIGLLYLFFIFENLFLKKELYFSYSKKDTVLLYAYPIFIFLFSLISYLIISFFKSDLSDMLSPLKIRHILEPHNFFYTGAVIFAYMMTQGLFFIKLTSKKENQISC